MTTNKDAKYRIDVLTKKAQELEANGHDRDKALKMLKTYHNQWFVTSHATQRQDLQTVLDRVWRDD